MYEDPIIKQAFKILKDLEQSKIRDMEKQRSWDEYFLNMLDLVKTRSPDVVFTDFSSRIGGFI
jgi:hypothetical protein